MNNEAHTSEFQIIKVQFLNAKSKENINNELFIIFYQTSNDFLLISIFFSIEKILNCFWTINFMHKTCIFEMLWLFFMKLWPDVIE
jgi:hypothetical protein